MKQIDTPLLPASDPFPHYSAMLDESRPVRERTWRQKFRDAFRGAKRGVRGQSSFFVHLFAAAAVVVAALALQVSLVEWCLLGLCVAGVLAAEMLNSALERLARAVDSSYNPDLRDALDIGSATVLMAAGGAAFVGTIIFGYRLLLLIGWVS
jgi:diacylglycerol kinase